VEQPVPLLPTFAVVLRAATLHATALVVNVLNHDEPALQLKVEKLHGGIRETGGSHQGNFELSQLSLLMPTVCLSL
jgi:hypothetical protein